MRLTLRSFNLPLPSMRTSMSSRPADANLWSAITQQNEHRGKKSRATALVISSMRMRAKNHTEKQAFKILDPLVLKTYYERKVLKLPAKLLTNLFLNLVTSYKKQQTNTHIEFSTGNFCVVTLANFFSRNK